MGAILKRRIALLVVGMLCFGAAWAIVPAMPAAWRTAIVVLTACIALFWARCGTEGSWWQVALAFIVGFVLGGFAGNSLAIPAEITAILGGDLFATILLAWSARHAESTPTFFSLKHREAALALICVNIVLLVLAVDAYCGVSIS